MINFKLEYVYGMFVQLQTYSICFVGLNNLFKAIQNNVKIELKEKVTGVNTL